MTKEGWQWSLGVVGLITAVLGLYATLGWGWQPYVVTLVMGAGILGSVVRNHRKPPPEPPIDYTRVF